MTLEELNFVKTWKNKEWNTRMAVKLKNKKNPKLIFLNSAVLRSASGGVVCMAALEKKQKLDILFALMEEFK